MTHAARVEYLMESALEPERLEKKTDPAETRRQLLLVGVEPGQRVLDAGGGTGAVSRVISEVVGPTGRVVCLDQSADRLSVGASLARTQGCTNLEFVLGDLLDPGMRGEFDLVWSRFVLEYLPDPVPAIRALAATLRPGGKLVAGDLDGHALFLHPMSDTLHSGLDAVFRGLAGKFDPYAGRKLYGYLRAAGLSRVQVHLMPYQVYAGAAPEGAMHNWETKFAVIRRDVIDQFASERAYDSFVTEFLDHLRSPDTFLYSTLILAEGIAT